MYLTSGNWSLIKKTSIVHDTFSALVKALARREETRGTGLWIDQMEKEEQYQLIRELLEPEFGPLYVTPPDIDQRIRQLSAVISEGIHRAVF